MGKKIVFIGFFLLLGAALSLVGCRNKTGREYPIPENVLLIVVDTLRVDRLSGYGYEVPVSPNIDRLMGKSVVFTNARSTTNFTTPSFASILTGLDVNRHDVRALDFRDRLDDRIITLPEVAQEAGVRTHAVSASIAFVFCNIRQGFDLFDARFINDQMPFDWETNPVFNKKHRTADEVTDAALEFLRGPETSPFFLLVHYFEPHWRKERDPIEKEKGLTAAYDLDVRFVDEQIGRLLEGMADLNLLEKTAIIFTADHGENLLDEDPKKRDHHDIFENVTRIPLFFAIPGIQPATREEPVQSTDVFPTVAEWLGGAELPYDIDGQSLAPLLTGQKAEQFNDRTLFFRQTLYFVENQMPVNFGLTDGEWKYVGTVESPNDEGSEKIILSRLFHLPEDPRARVDCSSDFPELTRAKRERMLDWVERQARIYETPVEEVDENVEALRALGYIQ